MKALTLAGIAMVALAPAVLFTTNAASQSIVQIAASDPQFSTLVTALKAADLVKTLEGPGPFTVFAPTNAAFAKIKKATLDGLLKNKALLTKVLTYHVVPGTVMAADVVKMNGKVAKSLEGADLRIHVTGAAVRINRSNVTKTDIIASNGVIHVIDRVLIPTTTK
jgi:uncharacterized surface protein with fasciclin (FAS1) repeats